MLWVIVSETSSALHLENSVVDASIIQEGGPFHILLDFCVSKTLLCSPILFCFVHISKKAQLHCYFSPCFYFHQAIHLAYSNRKSNSGFKRWDLFILHNKKFSGMLLRADMILWWCHQAPGFLLCSAIPSVYSFILLLMVS